MTEGIKKLDTELLLSFQVITDTHVTGDPEHIHNRNLENALLDIAKQAPGTAGIMHVGDLTDHGFPREYEEWHKIWSRHEGTLPAPLFTTGNHDVGLGVWPDRLDRFVEATEMPGAYHDHWVNGYHFIFLGTEKNLELFCTLSEQQLEWLDRKLGEKASPEQPVFVFLHQPLMNTVSGSYEAQEWYGVTEDQELRAVLSKYPQAILFTGHTHWELEAPNCHFDGKGKLPHMFNAASVAYLWTDEDEHKDGSQGFFVEVYPGHVRVRGRDFAAGKWIEAAQFQIETAAAINSAK
jgi:3',5'-cyclic-AMP phosphodiesterase